MKPHPKWSTVLLSSQLPTDYITSVLSKMFERLVYVRLGRYLERSGVLPTTQFAYRKGLGTCKGKVYYGQEPLSGESTTTECGFNYQLLAVIY